MLLSLWISNSFNYWCNWCCRYNFCNCSSMISAGKMIMMNAARHLFLGANNALAFWNYASVIDLCPGWIISSSYVLGCCIEILDTWEKEMPTDKKRVLFDLRKRDFDVLQDLVRIAYSHFLCFFSYVFYAGEGLVYSQCGSRYGNWINICLASHKIMFLNISIKNYCKYLVVYFLHYYMPILLRNDDYDDWGNKKCSGHYKL